MTITELCMEVNNFFVYDAEHKAHPHKGVFTISDGVVAPLDFLIPEQYFWIRGSKLNNGVYKYTANQIPELVGRNETFNGVIYEMFVDTAFIQVFEEIKAWHEKYGNVNSANMSPYTSESISGVFSRSMKSGSGGASVTWKQNFAIGDNDRLSKWRRVSVF